MRAHRQHDGGGQAAVGCAVVTVSDTRTPETDTSGACVRRLLEEAGHRVRAYAVLPDDPGRIRAHVASLCATEGIEAVLVNGGTGLAPRDTTYEAIVGLLEKRLDGFGELFRMLSWQQVGSAAMLSRAAAGVAGGRIVASLPGSPAAVELAMRQLILPELRHMVALVRG
jgi:molybdenum cofactor biosynthesis protein B